MIDSAKYPALSKLDDMSGERAAILDFLEWLGEQRIDLCSLVPGVSVDRWAPITEGREALAARRLGIDLRAVENERRAILANIKPAIGVSR